MNRRPPASLSLSSQYGASAARFTAPCLFSDDKNPLSMQVATMLSWQLEAALGQPIKLSVLHHVIEDFRLL